MKQKYFIKDCLECGGETIVMDSRLHSSGYIWRRRKCKECSFSFSTIEIKDTTYQDCTMQKEIERLTKENRRLKAKINDIKQIIEQEEQ